MTVTVDDLLLLLSATATNAERVRGLMQMGLSQRTLARATGCQSPSTLRNWGAGHNEPREDAAITLDDIRITAVTLLKAGMEPERVARWFMSRDDDRFDNARPIDRVREDPMGVLLAAKQDAMELTLERQPELVAVGAQAG